MTTLQTMPENRSTPQTADSASLDTASQVNPSATRATNSEPIVRRRRSTRRPRRSKTKKLSTQDRDRQLKRRLELKVLLIATPTLLVIVGGILWAISNANPDKSMHPKGLIRLSYCMLSIGLTIGIVALFADWTQKFLKIRKEKREKAAENATLKRKRSSRRRHRSR